MSRHFTVAVFVVWEGKVLLHRHLRWHPYLGTDQHMIGSWCSMICDKANLGTRHQAFEYCRKDLCYIGSYK